MAPGFLALGLTHPDRLSPPLTETSKLPSLRAHDIQTALNHFQVSAFEPADAFNHGLMGRFVDDEDAWLKGPYVQVGPSLNRPGFSRHP